MIQGIYRLAWVIMVAAGITPAVAQPLQSGDPGFGRQWIRQHPFSIQAVSLYPQTWNINDYFGANMTLLNRDVGNPFTIINRPPPYANTAWHAFVSPDESVYEAIRNVPGNTGWIIRDEPNRLQFPTVASIYQYIRQRDPYKVLYTTLQHDETPPLYQYGDSSHPDYTYAEYVDDFITLVNPDILVYDKYSFYSDGSTNTYYLRNLMTIRNKALAAGIPYWGWMQAFGRSQGREPSESDVRFNVYTHLTAGYTGLLYWTYDYYAGTGDGMIDINGNKTPLYYAVAQTNAEAIHLGQSLRFLTSTDVRFVPGRHVVSGAITAPNATPEGLTNWSFGAGSDPHIVSIGVLWNMAEGVGPEKNGLIGFFTDDEGERYFMLTNLYHGANLSGEDATLSFSITFDPTVNSIWRLNRETGLPEKIVLTHHMLNWTLSGGTGDLFKYDNGNFAGVIPEPATGAIVLVGLLLTTGQCFFCPHPSTARTATARKMDRISPTSIKE